MTKNQQKLRMFLKNNGYSLNRFGPALGLTRQAIQHWERIPDEYLKTTAKLLKLRQKDVINLGENK